MKAKIFIFLIFTLFFVNPVFAQTDSSSGGGPTDSSGSGSQTTQFESIKLQNPLGTTDNIPDFIRDLLDIVLEIGIPIIALAIIYAGYKFIAAQGNPEKLNEAKRTLKYILIGAGILLAAYVIAEAIVGTINAIRG